MSLLQIRGSDAQETCNSLVTSIPTKCLFGPKHWDVDEGRRKKREREHKGWGWTGQVIQSARLGAYRLALVFIHRGLHLPNLLPIWKNLEMTDFEGILSNRRFKTKTHQLILILASRLDHFSQVHLYECIRCARMYIHVFLFL